jgi:preprotein translocase subunit YajC
MGQLVNMLPLLMIMVVFYFFILRPQNTRQNDQKTFLDGIAKGDTVGLASGIIGKINAIEGPIVTIEIDKNTFIKVTKTSVSKEVTDSLKAIA